MTILLCFEIAIIFCWILYLICAFLDLKENNFKSTTKVEFSKWHRSTRKRVNYKSEIKTTSLKGFYTNLFLFCLFLVFTFLVH